MVAGSLISDFSGQKANSPLFWLFVVAIPALLWLIAIWVRGVVYLLGHIRANAWGRHCEEAILQEVVRGCRALQILQGTFITGHLRSAAALNELPVDALLQNKSALHTQSTWKGNY
ncbi:hypothetical protein FCJ48_18270 [Salmonella enterica]|nr:hypothetical protein [Salmonella enterica]